MFVLLPFLLTSLAFPQSQTPEAFAPVPGMELLPVLQRARDAGPAPADQHVSLAVSLPFAQPQEAQAFVDSVSDPRSGQYRRFLSPEQIGERFGQPQARVDALADYLRHSGFDVTLVSKTRLSILAEGNVALAERAFHTTLRRFTVTPQDAYEPAEFIAWSSAVQVPVEFAPYVIDVSGLETHTRPRPLVSLLTPFLTRGLYSLATMFNGGFSGAGRTLGVSNWDGFRAADYLQFLASFGLPIPASGAGTNIVTIPCNGGGLGAGAPGGEGDLDIQMALETAPLANIRIYDGSIAMNLVGMLSVQTNDNQCDVITESYGWQAPTTTLNAAHNQHVAMSAEGITYMAATGDNGTSVDPFGYPCMDPEVLGVGGTTANVDPATGHRLSEIGWSGSGGGWSTQGLAFNVRPSWQVGNGVPPVNGSNNHRLFPDLAFHAAGQGAGGAYLFYTGGALTGGSVGTSFASPIFAGALATTEQKIISLGGLTPDGLGHRRFGRIQNLIYAENGDPTIWFDITVGFNGNLPAGQGGSSAHAGWDTVCGWGPMNCEAFAPIAACATGAVCGGGSPGTPFCFGDGIDPLVTTMCPCLNFGSPGHGCANAFNFVGAELTATGSTAPDTVQLTSAGEPNTSLSIFLQGTVSNGGGALFGDGVRCTAGVLKRLYVHNASGGSVSAPVGTDVPISVRSAQLGDSILPGTPRFYQTYYRDSNLSFCTGLGYNISGGLRIDW